MMSNKAQYLLASIVESSQDSIVTINLDRIITSWNKAAEDLYGYKAAEVVGKPLSIVMLPADIGDLIRKVDDIIEEMTVPIYQTIRVHKSGKHADLEIMLSPVRNAAGAVIGISTIARDITVRKIQEAQKDDFIAIASHELNSPLTSLKAYTEILGDRFENTNDQISGKMVNKLQRQVTRLMELVRTLLDTTKLLAGEVLLNPTQFDLNDLVREHIDSLKYISPQHQVTFKAGTINPIIADRKLIGQVLTNLISNAFKYSPDADKIIIASSDTGDGVQVIIQDFGIGIPKTEREKIFDRYFRVNNLLTTTSSGTGLGLFITTSIIKQHGGSISVQSQEGVGSTFFVTLPYTLDK